MINFCLFSNIYDTTFTVECQVLTYCLDSSLSRFSTEKMLHQCNIACLAFEATNQRAV